MNLDIWDILYMLAMSGLIIYSLWAIWDSLLNKDGFELLVASVMLAGFILALVWSWVALPILLFFFLILTAISFMRDEKRERQDAERAKIQALRDELQELRQDIHSHSY